MKNVFFVFIVIPALLFNSCVEKEDNPITYTNNDSTSNTNLLLVGGQQITISDIRTDLFPGESDRYYIISGNNNISVMAIFNGGIPASYSYSTTVNTIDAFKCRVVLQLNGGGEVYYANEGSTVSVSNVGNDKIKISFDTISFTELGATGTPKTNTVKATFTCSKQ